MPTSNLEHIALVLFFGYAGFALLGVLYNINRVIRALAVLIEAFTQNVLQAKENRQR